MAKAPPLRVNAKLYVQLLTWKIKKKYIFESHNKKGAYKMTFMKIITLLIIAVFWISCTTSKSSSLNTNEIKMISVLTDIKKENKFIEGSNGWDGYSGCQNPDEKNAYSKNIENLIDELIKSIKNKKDKEELQIVLNKFLINAVNLEEEYHADTDESEMRYMYFERIKNACQIL